MPKNIVTPKKAPKNSPKQEKSKRPNINLLATMTVLLVGLGLIVFQLQQSQDIRSKAAGDCDVNAAMLEITTQEQHMMTLINNYRAMQGRTALSWDPNLNYPAAWMAKDMTITKRINHTDTFGRTPNQRFVVCAVPSGGTFAENVLIGPSNADEVFLNWQTTPTERTNMLDPLFNTAAVGVEYDATGQGYWVLVLAGPYVGGNVTRTPGSNPTAIPIVTEGPSISTVPSPNCLGQCPTLVPPVSGAPIGGGNPTPTIYLPPGGNPEPTQPGGGNPVPTQPANGTPQPTQPGGENPEPTQVGGGNPGGGNPGGGKPGEGDQGGIIGLFLLFLAMIIQFFLSLIGK